MTGWMTFCRVGIITPVFLVLQPFSSLVAADEPAKSSKNAVAKPTIAQLRAAAESAEKCGDWEAAFAAYCHLFVADRNQREIREKLNITLRRVQQVRRHRDAQYQKYVASTSMSDALNLFAEVIAKVPMTYVDRERATPQLLWENGVEELSRALASPAFCQAFLDSNGSDAKFAEFRKSLQDWTKHGIKDAKSARATLRKLLITAQETATIKNSSALVLEMVCGSCGGLDEYTIFLNPTQVKPDSSTLLNLSPYGIYLSVADGDLVISGIAAGSWAAECTPLRTGDKIARLNGHSMESATLARTAEVIRTVPGLMQTLEIATGDSDEPALQVELPLVVPTVYGMRVLRERVGYVRIGSFSPSTPRELDDALSMLKTQSDIRSIVIDLRGNMGGSFLASVETARRLIPSGLIVTTQGQLSEVANQPFTSESGMAAHDLPAVVLINAETASAAEVLAAALKDNNRATLIGMPTFGKGAIQYPLRLVSLDEGDDPTQSNNNRSGTIRLTIAKLIAPRGGAINGIGISPHILEADPSRQLELAVEKAMELIPMVQRP